MFVYADSVVYGPSSIPIWIYIPILTISTYHKHPHVTILAVQSNHVYHPIYSAGLSPLWLQSKAKSKIYKTCLFLLYHGHSILFLSAIFSSLTPAVSNVPTRKLKRSGQFTREKADEYTESMEPSKPDHGYKRRFRVWYGWSSRAYSISTGHGRRLAAMDSGCSSLRFSPGMNNESK